jgi:hypothetical protein
LTVDQRGQPRAGDCDIGAFQSQKPASMALPAITGSPALGKTLTCSQGTWTGDAPLTYAYLWSRGPNTISGATSASYKVATADRGHALSCIVTATNPYASVAASSASVSVPPKPSITKFKQSHRRWRRSTTFTFKLNTAASVTLKFTRCTTKRHKLKCNHSAGSLKSKKAHAGTDKVKFTGKLSKHKKLKPGTYAVTIVASGSSGKSTSKALHFTVTGST